jgi:ribonuclease D
MQKSNKLMHNLFLEDIPSDLKVVGDIAIDTETLGLKLKRDRLCLVQIADSVGNVFLVKYGKNTTFNSPNLKKLIEDPLRMKIFHYARFDVAVLMYSLKIAKIENIFCTKIASKLTRTYTDSHGLKSICRELLGVELDKESQSSNWGAEELTERQLKYAMNDVIHLHKLRNILISLLKEREREDLAKGAFEFLHYSCKMEIEDFDPILILTH